MMAALGQVDTWTGRILIGATNLIEAPTFRKADLGGRTSSEVVAALAVGAQCSRRADHCPPRTFIELT